MKTFAIAVLAGTAALSAGSARASDIYIASEYAHPDLVQQARTVCDRYGNCYQSRSEVVVQDTFNYVPRDRYNPPPPRYRNRNWDDGPRAGVGIRAPASGPTSIR